MNTPRDRSRDICVREYAIPNYMSTNYLCDSAVNPARVVTDVSSIDVNRHTHSV